MISKKIGYLLAGIGNSSNEKYMTCKDQANTTYGPRAKCGPRKLLIRPATTKFLLTGYPLNWVKM